MGGYNSGGHRWGRQRAAVEACYRFDAKMLRKLLTAPPGAHLAASFGWTGPRGEDAKAIAAYRAGDSFLTLHFERSGETDKPPPQKIALLFSPCRFGGRRAWFVCGLCQRRAFRLYLYPHFYMNEKRIDRFYCRVCLGLTYDQRRSKDLVTLGQMRARRVQKQLHDTAHEWEWLPDKPKYMRWRTYDRLAAQHQNAVALANVGFMDRLRNRFPHILEGMNFPRTD